MRVSQGRLHEGAGLAEAMERIWLSSYAEGVPHDIEPVTGSLTDLLDSSVSQYAERTALEFFGAETTYSRLGDRVARAAEGLRRLGVRKGDRVALVLRTARST